MAELAAISSGRQTLMLELSIPGFGTFSVSCLVLDYNGTIACDGVPIQKVNSILEELSRSLSIHVLTADTFGNVRQELLCTACDVTVIGKDKQTEAKADYIRKLGAANVVAIGNGRNDVLMLREAALGIAVIQTEGAAVEALLAADLVTNSIQDALELLLYPLRAVATLRR